MKPKKQPPIIKPDCKHHLIGKPTMRTDETYFDFCDKCENNITVSKEYYEKTQHTNNRH